MNLHCKQTTVAFTFHSLLFTKLTPADVLRCAELKVTFGHMTTSFVGVQINM